ncbi:hypothetical protein Q5P01_010692 [Channa striata]|uniref:Uncharacterized protein n=1 Tax=Channa striata TaxID=64152 RepID=A0AA88SSR2_CHASR|nr:hypothetical protein Q5P01_010692 [Channa striata]
MSHPASNGGNLHAITNNSGLNSGQQDPGLHSTSQDPGSSSRLPRTGPGRPYFYFHAPPPPPHMLQYQWPMPLYYNPFEGFPAMGYGVVMPPFHPSLYMEPPAYMVSHPHIVTGDYIRMLHPHIQAPIYQNPIQSRRVRPTQPVNRTVNSEVQTEPIQRYTDRWPHGGSDSGNGTTSNSPSSSSNSQKPDSAEAGDIESNSQQVRTLTSSNVRDLQEHRTCINSTIGHNVNMLPPTETKAESSIRASLEAHRGHEDAVVQDSGSNCRNVHCNIWSVSSSDSLGPVCSSSKQEDEVLKEKCASTSDGQMSWGSGTPQGTVVKSVVPKKVQPQENQVLTSETQLEQHNAEGVLQSKDSVGLKIIKLPFSFIELLSESQDDITEIVPYEVSLNYCKRKEKCNDSVWSVESLPPFVPNKEWVLQSGLSAPKVIEMTEKAECETLGQESPVNKEQEKNNCLFEKEPTPSNTPVMEKMLPPGLFVQNGMDVETKDCSGGQLSVPGTDQKMDETSPSKSHLVDCGIQCNKFQELKCICEEMKSSMAPSRRQLFNISEMQKFSTVSTDKFYMNGHVQKKQQRPGQWRSKVSDKNSSQQESYAGYSGKSKGGNARKHRY